MALFYERTETNSEIVIVYKNYILLWIFVVLIIFSDFIFMGLIKDIALVAFLLFIIIFLVDTWKPYREIRKAMKEKGVLVSGSKFSFSNPCKVVIKK